jgi:SH3 domain protein
MLKRLLLLALLMPMLAYSAHITDKLLAGMYAEPSRGEQPIQLLPSGTPVELLGEQDGFVQVQLVDGKTGWVEKRFLSEDKPARVRLLALQSKYRQLQGTLDAAEKQLLTVEQPKSVKKRNPDESQVTRQSEQTLMANLDQANAVIKKLKDEAKLLTKRHTVELEEVSSLELERVSEPVVNSEAGTSWVAIIIMLIIGVAGGIYAGMGIQERRQLKKHGGFRI